MRVHAFIIYLTALVCLYGYVGAIALEKRDACSNGVKICGSGSVSCSGNTCTACSGGKCCKVARPYDSSCNQATPCVNLDACTTGSTGNSGSGGSTGGSGTSTGGALPKCTRSQLFLKAFGFRVNCQ